MFTNMAKTLAAFLNPGFLILGFIFGFGFSVHDWGMVLFFFFILPIVIGLGLGFVAAWLDERRHRSYTDKSVQLFLDQIVASKQAQAFHPDASQAVN